MLNCRHCCGSAAFLFIKAFYKVLPSKGGVWYNFIYSYSTFTSSLERKTPMKFFHLSLKIDDIKQLILFAPGFEVWQS